MGALGEIVHSLCPKLRIEHELTPVCIQKFPVSDIFEITCIFFKTFDFYFLLQFSLPFPVFLCFVSVIFSKNPVNPGHCRRSTGLLIKCLQKVDFIAIINIIKLNGSCAFVQHMIE